MEQHTLNTKSAHVREVISRLRAVLLTPDVENALKEHLETEASLKGTEQNDGGLVFECSLLTYEKQWWH